MREHDVLSRLATATRSTPGRWLLPVTPPAEWATGFDHDGSDVLGLASPLAHSSAARCAKPEAIHCLKRYITREIFSAPY